MRSPSTYLPQDAPGHAQNQKEAVEKEEMVAPENTVPLSAKVIQQVLELLGSLAVTGHTSAVQIVLPTALQYTATVEPNRCC